MGNFSQVSPVARLKPGNTATAGSAVSFPSASTRYTAKPMQRSSFCPKLQATVMTSLLAKATAFCMGRSSLRRRHYVRALATRRRSCDRRHDNVKVALAARKKRREASGLHGPDAFSPTGRGGVTARRSSCRGVAWPGRGSAGDGLRGGRGYRRGGRGDRRGGRGGRG